LLLLLMLLLSYWLCQTNYFLPTFTQIIMWRYLLALVLVFGTAKTDLVFTLGYGVLDPLSLFIAMSLFLFLCISLPIPPAAVGMETMYVFFFCCCQCVANKRC
jgi:hypothetical protein